MPTPTKIEAALELLSPAVMVIPATIVTINGSKYICQFIHAVSTIIRFGSPFVIIVAILYDSIIASAVTFGFF
jgi:hypothetical protein